MIINRYLVSEIRKPLVVILAILVALFGSFSTAGFLSDAVNGLLPTNVIAELIGLKVLISLEVLIPISLYLSIVLAFGKLYGDSELTVMYALRVSPMRVMGAALTLAAGLAVVVAALSLVARPWAYQKMHEISRRAEAQLDVSDMAAGTFYVGDNGNRVIFLAHRNGPNSPARDVFVQLRRRNSIQVIYARVAYELPSSKPSGGSNVYLGNANIYEISREKGKPDHAINVQSLVVNPNAQGEMSPKYSSVAATTVDLAQSDTPSDIAEFQWRLSTALSVILLAMLAVPLSRAQPRQGKYAKIGTAILIYSAYYLLYTTARTWVQNAVVPSIPGIWWAPAMLGLVVLVALLMPSMIFKYRRSPV
ncbi:MAG: LPS export ABC transporter permease LptF [Alphaproteobacteria bacterium]|nr:LPS export ABC transporter permease LptF [Alphaproteobacteria bacterium]MBU6471389.1 LPS export ABC transporter permease LptF [Alphaproteobacteria bacterium]MDE2011744.1 LPS export ABC transporter permease LptF [Alphaproteobacteria bacterium]MDE2072960.1 LPS export ABC transporter permease LptF [Alphaproteobacteria bacterium]MDE2351836.1 LPS export ABC transporter permease LptF [Alphaproteobacteria bacterium]